MKRFLIALAAALTFVACSDDDPAEEVVPQPEPESAAWENLPTTPITGENATLTVNGETNPAGSATLTATSATEGTLLLENVLPGYASIEMDVTLAERSDDTGTFDFTGETGLTTPPAMIARADAGVIFDVAASGSITADGKIAVTLTSALNAEAQGGLTGTWNLLTNIEVDNEMGTLLTAPLWVTWSAKDTEQPNAEQLATAVRQFGSSLLYQFLHSVTLMPDGNVTAEYWDGEGLDWQTELPTYLMSGFEYNDDFVPVAMLNLHPDKPWLESPKNVAFWYVKGDYLYVVPNITAILGQAGAGSDGSAGMEGIADLVASLSEYGIDINALLPTVMQWMETGIPLKYEKTEGGLKLYADKEMCGPIIEALLPALPKVDELLDKLVAENPDDEMIQMLPMLKGMLGIESFASLDPIWRGNTDQFDISLNFVK